MKAELFVGTRVYHAIEANDGIAKMHQGVLSCMEELFPGAIDQDEYSQTVASGSVNEILIFRLDAVINERADHEVVHSKSFKPASKILRKLGNVLEDYIGNIVNSLTLIVVIKLELLRENRVYDTCYYRGKAMFEKGLVTILREENTEAPSP